MYICTQVITIKKSIKMKKDLFKLFGAITVVMIALELLGANFS